MRKNAKPTDDPFAGPEMPSIRDDMKELHNRSQLTSIMGSVRKTLEEGERGTFVETAVANVEPIQGQLVPYTRIIDLSDQLQLVPLIELQHRDLCVWSYDKHEGDPEMGPFLTMEVSLLDDPGNQHFLVNCGGIDVIRKMESAFKAVSDGKAILPLVASFAKKKLNSGFSFWQMS